MATRPATMLRIITGQGVIPRPGWLEHVLTLLDVRRTRIDLSRLTDQQLTDIGLTRADVEAELARSALAVPAGWRRRR